MRNNNGTIVRKITGRAMSSDRKRNFFLILAITLTTFLIGSVFSVGMSLLESVQVNRIRYAGTLAHAAVGHPTASQLETLKSLDYVENVGTGNNVGYVEHTHGTENLALTLHYFDRTEWEELRSPANVDTVGSYPQNEDEIMATRWLLERLGIENPVIGMEIPIAYKTEVGDTGEVYNKIFRLSGWYTSYGVAISSGSADVLLVSEALSRLHGKTVEADGSASVVFDDPQRVMEYCNALASDLGASEDQQIVTSSLYDTDTGETATTLAALGAVVLFLIFIGYLLIYNVLYISVSRDVRFFGLLKTVGMTPRQIKRVVIGQIVRLCAIGIPIGVVSALLLSLVLIPTVIMGLGVVSTEAVVSFSPLIYIGAVIFALLTAILGALKPAKMAASISPVEAQKFTGVAVKKTSAHTTANGKSYKMALRNIFRDKKRAASVLLSLFLGVTTFITVSTLVLSMDMVQYIESNYESDFTLKNNAYPMQAFDGEIIGRLEALPGFERLDMTTRGEMRLDYTSSGFGAYLAELATQPGYGQIIEMLDEDIRESFRGFVLGVDGEMLAKSVRTAQGDLDIDAFMRGELALIATDNPSLFSQVNELIIAPISDSANDRPTVSIPLGGFVPFDYRGTGSGFAPTVIVSNTLMREWFGEPIVSQINLDISSDYEQNDLLVLRQITGDMPEISLTSKLDVLRELTGAKTVLFSLGGGIALVIALIGILNFVNVMSVSVMVRKHELATLESVGMSRKQVKSLLVSEGLGYAFITAILVMSAGNAIAYGIFKLFERQMDYVVFSYPFVPVILVMTAVLAICWFTPRMIYRSINKATLVERLRDTE